MLNTSVPYALGQGSQTQIAPRARED